MSEILNDIFRSENLHQILLALILLFVLYMLYDYNKKRKYPPGPMGLPLLGYSPFLGSEPHKTMQKLSKKYGNVMSLYMGSQYTVIFNEYEVFRDAIRHPSALNRSPNIFMHLHNAGFASANGEEWQEQRRFFMYFLRDLGLARGLWNDILREEVNEFVSDLKAHKGMPLDTTSLLSRSLNNNIISLLIGRKFRKGAEEEKIKLFSDFSKAAFIFSGPANVATLMPSLRKYLEFFKIAGYDHAANVVKKCCNLIREEIMEHKSSDGKNCFSDAIYLYLKEMNQMQTKNTKHFFSDTNLEGNLKIMFLGATDTVFNSMTWIIRLMSKYQDVQRKVQAELDEVIGKDGSITFEERTKIPYVFATILESQRYSSIVPLSTTRLVSADFQIGEYTIPKGAELFGNNWAMHNDPDYWDEPQIFRPERFLTEDGTGLIKTPPSYVVFSLGRRNCPGETVAWMTIVTYFTSIMQNFHVSPISGEEVNFKYKNGLVIQLQPQLLCFTDRIQSRSD